MANNLLLFNAALNGFISGAFAGGYPVSATPSDYDAIASQALVFATAMDAAIANDASISAAPGTATTGAGSSALVEQQSAKPALLQSLVHGITFSRYQTGSLASVFTTEIAAIKAIYTQLLTKAVFI